MNIIVSRMEDTDIPEIMHIQSENLRENLTPSRQKDGYLSIAFSGEELRRFNDDLCVAVAKEGDKPVGYCCISSSRFNASFPILDQIVANLSSYSVPGGQDSPGVENSCIHGPVCIARSHRGKGILKKLFTKGIEEAKRAGYVYFFTFISLENARSLAGHMKLPFRRVGKVAYHDKEYSVLACTV